MALWLTSAVLIFLSALHTGSAQTLRLPPVPANPGAAGSPNSAQAPGPGSAFDNIYDYLTSNPEFSSLVQLIDAAPSSADLLSVLDAQCGGTNSTSITFLAPTNQGIQKALGATQPPTSVAQLEKNPNVVVQILMYHILPTPLPLTALKDGNSFNTILTTSNSLPVSVAINNVPGQGITIQGSTNSARITDQGVQVCSANPSIVYALGGLLLPGTVASNAQAGVQSTPASTTPGGATGSATGSR